MNRNAVRIFAYILCVIFAGFYYLLFNKQIKEDDLVLDTNQIEESEITVYEEKEIYWLQLGIFNSKESVEDLIDRCVKIGIECHTYTKNGSITAFCNGTDEPSTLTDIKKLLSENDIEYYEKSVWITDQTQLKKLIENPKEAYLEVIASLP